MFKVDLNSDLGESFGAYKMGSDKEILKNVTSANIACGFHAGDPAVMRKTVKMAIESGCAIGAHPGMQDLVGFGRRKLEITPAEAYEIVLYQIGALAAFVKAEGGKLQHVKPHGALYNMAAKDAALAEAIAQAVYKFDSSLSIGDGSFWTLAMLLGCPMGTVLFGHKQDKRGRSFFVNFCNELQRPAGTFFFRSIGDFPFGHARRCF